MPVVNRTQLESAMEDDERMDKAIVFGALKNDKRTYDRIRESYEIISYSDNDETKCGGYILVTYR